MSIHQKYKNLNILRRKALLIKKKNIHYIKNSFLAEVSIQKGKKISSLVKLISRNSLTHELVRRRQKLETS